MLLLICGMTIEMSSQRKAYVFAEKSLMLPYIMLPNTYIFHELFFPMVIYFSVILSEGLDGVYWIAEYLSVFKLSPEK